MKTTIIGAGSASFGLGSLRDAVRQQELRGSTLVLVDLDPEALDRMARLAQLMSEAAGARLKIQATTDRRKALRGADFVVTAFAVNRDALWKLDYQVPLKHGIKQVNGENGGPGGLFHTLRNVPIILGIARDMEELCPDALLINFSNPESRLCMAVDRYTSIRAIGLCHGIHGQLGQLSRVMGVPCENLDCKAAGLNHFTWIQDLRLKDTGKDAYPLLREKLADFDPAFEPFQRYLFQRFGLYPSPGDNHSGEYVAWAWEFGVRGWDFEAGARYREEQAKRIEALLSGSESVKKLVTRPSGERAFPIIGGILSNSNHLELAVNIPNNGCIPNLPADAIVEVPAVISGAGVQGLRVDPLPEGIAALCNTQVEVQRLAVDAAVLGSRELALQALLADPVVQSYSAAEKTLDELLALEAEYLPQFAG